MEYPPCISQIATLLADPKRSAMMWALMDGTARPADELALIAGVSASSANAHLGRLSTGGLLKLETRGRRRFFRLAAPEIGVAVEALASASLASTSLAEPEGLKRNAEDLRPPTPPSSLRRARICHDHLGGELATALYQRLLSDGWIEQVEQKVEVTSKGVARFAERGIFIQALAHGERQTACACPDWSERKPHLGGALGAGLLQLFLQSGWLCLLDESRALQVSSNGQREIDKLAANAELEWVI